MKIAVTAMGDTLEDQVAFRLGRNAYYLIVDTETQNVEPIEDPGHGEDGGLSDVCIQLMVMRGVEWMVTGHCPSVYLDTLEKAGIPVRQGASGSVMEVIEILEHEITCASTVVESEPTLITVSSPVDSSSIQTDADYQQLKAEMVVMQRKLFELYRRVAILEKSND